MKAIIVLLILSISGTIYSQDYTALKKSDTVYVLFKGKKKRERKSIQPQTKYNYDDRVYYFFGLDQESLRFYHFKYSSYENSVANIVSDVKVVDKSFLKKNKPKIITPKLLKNYIFCVAVSEILNNSKKIYVIDCTEEKEGKIKLYEVQLGSICRGDG